MFKNAKSSPQLSVKKYYPKIYANTCKKQLCIMQNV